MDKGASWIHGADPGHPIKELADKFNLTTFATHGVLESTFYTNRTEVGEKASTNFFQVSWAPIQVLLPKNVCKKKSYETVFRSF